MVRKSFIPLSIVMALSLLFLPGVSIAQLDTSVSTTRSELGKAIQLRLFSTQQSPSLANIDLSSLKNDFHVKNIGDAYLDNKGQQLAITLYPRKIGTIRIPKLHFHRDTSSPISILVTPAIDPKNNSTIETGYTVSTFSPWKKQQVLVKLRLMSQSQILVLNTPKAYTQNGKIIKLSVSSSSTEPGKTLHSAGWALFPEKSGKLEFDLPAIELVRDGVTTHRFYPPLINLDVKELPIYVPATMPVGKLEIVNLQEPDLIKTTNSINNIRFTLKGIGLLPEYLPNLNSKFKSDETINFYPANIQASITNTQHGLISVHEYLVNYKANQQGSHIFNIIGLNYFDPDTGKIVTLQHGLGSSFSLHIVAITLLLLFIFVLTFYFVRAGYLWLLGKWRSFFYYKKILNSVNEISNAMGIKTSLMEIACAEKWHNNLSLRQWHKLWTSQFQTSCPLDITLLEKMLYSGSKKDIENIKDKVSQLCLLRWPILKILK